VDRITGQLSDTRTRFLGTRPPKLFAAAVKGQRSMLSLSSRPWLGYSDMGRYNLTPLSYEALDYASGVFAHTFRQTSLAHTYVVAGMMHVGFMLASVRASFGSRSSPPCICFLSSHCWQ